MPFIITAVADVTPGLPTSSVFVFLFQMSFSNIIKNMTLFFNTIFFVSSLCIIQNKYYNILRLPGAPLCMLNMQIYDEYTYVFLNEWTEQKRKNIKKTDPFIFIFSPFIFIHWYERCRLDVDVDGSEDIDGNERYGIVAPQDAHIAWLKDSWISRVGGMCVMWPKGNW